MFKKLALAAILVFATFGSYAQRAIVAGEDSPGVYSNIATDGAQALKVSIAGTSSGGVVAAAMATTAPTVTSSSTTILAANTARKNLLIQNNDTAGIIYINFATTATTAHLKIAPGATLYLTGIIPVTAIRAIGSIASNANVVVVEGQ